MADTGVENAGTFEGFVAAGVRRRGIGLLVRGHGDRRRSNAHRHAGLRLRHPGRFHPVRPDAARRRAVPPPYALRRADRPGGHHALQAHLHRLQIRRRSRRLRAAHAARMGDPGQPVPAADGLCAALAPLRAEPRARCDALLSAGRMERRRRAPGGGVRAVELPRQYRGGADRRHHGPSCVPRQSPHRLSRRDRRGIERRRLRQRRRRHHDHDDVDRRRQSVVGGGSLCGRRRGAGGVRGPGRAPAASLLADRAGGAGRPEDRVDPRGHRRGDPGRRDPRQCHRQPPVSGAARPHSGDRSRRMGRDPRRRAAAPAGLVGHARDLQGHDLPAWRWSPAPR